MGKYNVILGMMLEVEAALLAPHIATIDAALCRGMAPDDKSLHKGGENGMNLTWRSLSIDDFVAEAGVLVEEAYTTLAGVQVLTWPRRPCCRARPIQLRRHALALYRSELTALP